MPALSYGLSAYTRNRGNMPELPVINMFVERTPTTATGVILQSRSGLVESATIGSGPIAGMFQLDGFLSGVRFTVSGTGLYAGTTLVGTIGGTGPVSFAVSPDRLLVTRGTSLHRWDGTTFTTETMPDDVNVTAVAYLAGYEIALAAGTGKFYFRQYTSDEFDGLDFATAENEPDRLLDCVVVNDVLSLIGAETVEFWTISGNADLPFQPTLGRVFSRGIRATGCVCPFDNSFAWVGNTGLVYISSNVPERLSDEGIEERIAQSATCALFSYFHEGTEYLVLRLDQGSWVFSAASRQWSEFQSYGRVNWRAQCAIPGPVFGDDETGKLWVFGDTFVDAGGVLERRFRAGVPIPGGVVTANNLRLSVNTGNTPDLTGTYASPVVELRTSRDAAQTFSEWRPVPLGEQGVYRTRVEWRRLGMFDDPGMVAEFRVADPVPFRVSAVAINEASGGRSR